MGYKAASLASITTGYNVSFLRGLRAMTSATAYQSFAAEFTVNDPTTVFPIQGRSPQMREWIGPRNVRDTKVYGYSLTAKLFEATQKVRKQDVEDDKYGLYDGLMEGLGESAGRLPFDQVVAAIIAGTSNTCYDGEFFFDTDHPQDPSGAISTTYANEYGSMPLTASNAALARSYMEVRKDEEGRILGVNPNAVMVPSALRKTAEEIFRGATIIQAQTNVAGSENVGAAAPTNVMQGTFSIIVVPELDATSTTTWYMLDTRMQLKPFFWEWRIRPTFSRITSEDSEYVMSNDEYLFGARARGAAGYGLPQLASRFQSTSL